MSTRRAKQLIYGVFYGLIWILFFYACYFIFLRPSLTPSGPDCGSFCPPPGVKPIALQGTVSDFVTSDGHHTFLAHIANVNSDYAAQDFKYTFTAYDATGGVVQTVSGNSFIYANEIKYLLAPNVVISGAVDHVGLTMTNTQWVAGSILGLVPQFTFQNIQVGMTPSAVSVGGQITNGDFAGFSNVLVVAVFNGVDGSPLGVSQTQIDNLAAGESAPFSVIYPAVAGIDPSNNQIFAYALRK